MHRRQARGVTVVADAPGAVARPAAADAPPALEMRAFADRADWIVHARLGVAAFQPEVEGDEAERMAQAWTERTLEGPDVRGGGFGRGAFARGQLVGGYTMWLRPMRLGAGFARTACIGGVVTDPAWRMRGVGRAMMLDAVAEARRHRAAVILLSGIAGFYVPFGYADVWDPPSHHIPLAEALRLPEGPLAVRPARPEDAPALDALYRRHYQARYTGAFRRTVAVARHRVLTGREFGRGTVVAVDARGRVRGYAALPRRDGYPVREAAAGDAFALRALVRHHASLLAQGTPTAEELAWSVPTRGLTFSLLADAFPVRTEARREEGAGWMARPGDARALARAAGAALGDAAAAVDLWVDGLPCRPDAPASAVHAELSGQVFLALAFGHRPAAWARTRPGQRLPAAAAAVLDEALVRHPPWIAGGDWF